MPQKLRKCGVHYKPNSVCPKVRGYDEKTRIFESISGRKRLGKGVCVEVFTSTMEPLSKIAMATSLISSYSVN